MRYWTTSDRPAGDQFSYWREVICQAFTALTADRAAGSDARSQPERGLTSWVRSAPLRSVNCAEVASRSQVINHGPAEVRRTISDEVFVNLVVRGRCVVTQDGRTISVPAGSFSMVDTTTPYRQHYVEDPRAGEWRVVSFRVPRTQLIPHLGDPRSFTAVAHDARAGGIAGVVAATMVTTWKEIEALGSSERDAAEIALVALLAASSGSAHVLRETSKDALDANLRAMIKRFVAANLHGTADLSAGGVARKFGVSVRKLHSVFAASDRSFTQTVMSMRVEGCASDLRAGVETRSMTELASRWGFSDLSHLNRVFRAQYDCLPSEYQEQSRLASTDAGIRDHSLLLAGG